MEENLCCACHRICHSHNSIKHETCSSRHFYHLSCFDDTDQECNACITSCRLCHEKVTQAVYLCENETHRFHEACLTINRIDLHRDMCQVCFDLERQARILSPCSVCGLIIKTGRVKCDCGHDAHFDCRQAWKKCRVTNCPLCPFCQPICPICDEPIALNHRRHYLISCKKCNCIMTDVAKMRHVCDANCCMRCGKMHDDYDCKLILGNGMQLIDNKLWNRCLLCEEAPVKDFVNHECFMDWAKKITRCDTCGFSVPTGRFAWHARECIGSKCCLARKCTQIISIQVAEDAMNDISVLISDHNCRYLHACCACPAVFLEFGKLMNHKCDHSLPTRTLPKRVAFEKCNRTINAHCEQVKVAKSEKKNCDNSLYFFLKKSRCVVCFRRRMKSIWMILRPMGYLTDYRIHGTLF